MDIKKTSDLIKIINGCLVDKQITDCRSEYQLDQPPGQFASQFASQPANSPPVPNIFYRQITQYVRTLCFPLCISVYDDQMPLEHSFRICLTSKSSKANYDLPIVRNSNGLILVISRQTAATNGGLTNNVAGGLAVSRDTTTDQPAIWRCKPVVTPPGDFNHRTTDSKINQFLAQNHYVVLPIYDGTIISLYYYNNRWIMSSRNSCEMNDMVWRGHAYQQVFNHALARYQTFDFAKLNPMKQYTIGFCHPAYHPAFQPAEFLPEHYGQSCYHDPDNTLQHQWRIEVWVVQTNDDDIDRLGLPKQHAINIRDLATLYRNNEQAIYDATVSSASASAASTSSTVRRDLVRSAHMGYILRSKCPSVTGSHSDIILRSKLFMKIRDAVYEIGNIGLPKPLYDKYSEYYRDINFAIILTYVNHERTKYLDIFPQYAERIKQIEQLIHKLTKAISHNRVSAAGSSPLHTHVQQLYKQLYPIVTSDYKPSGQPADIKIITNKLMDVRYAIYYYEALCGVGGSAAATPNTVTTLGDFIKPPGVTGVTAVTPTPASATSASATSASASEYANPYTNTEQPGQYKRAPESYSSNAIAVLRSVAKQ